eukprot:gene45-biopygen19500
MVAGRSSKRARTRSVPILQVPRNLHRCIPTAPKTLRLVSTTRRQIFGGFYHIVHDQQANGMPVWKCGKNWLYTGLDGSWYFSEETEHIGMGKDFAESFGVIASSAPHGGLFADAVTSWESGDGEQWLEDTGVCVTSDRDSGGGARSAREARGVARR